MKSTRLYSALIIETIGVRDSACHPQQKGINNKEQRVSSYKAEIHKHNKRYKKEEEEEDIDLASPDHLRGGGGTIVILQQTQRRDGV